MISLTQQSSVESANALIAWTVKHIIGYSGKGMWTSDGPALADTGSTESHLYNIELNRVTANRQFGWGIRLSKLWI